MWDPDHGRWRAIRSVTLALVCGVLPLYGHHVNPFTARGSALALLCVGILGVGVRLTARRVSFLRMCALLLVGQLVVHVLVGVTIDRRVPGEVWTYQPRLPALEVGSATQVVLHLAASQLLVVLIAAALLYGGECNVWLWFRLATLRLLGRVPALVLPRTPDAPRHRSVHEAPSCRPSMLVSASGRRGPPVALAA